MAAPDKMHSTNYYHTLIEVADDCKAERGVVPPLRAGGKTLARLQFELLSESPYHFTSDEVLIQIHMQRKNLPGTMLNQVRRDLFSKGQPCLRTSPLPRQYGWGIHFNAEGKIAVAGRETDLYRLWQNEPEIAKLKAMRSSRVKSKQ